MRIIQPSYEIVHPTDFSGMMNRLELAGRTCYKSEGNVAPDSADRFVKARIKSGHESVIEHEIISVRIICDRGVSHELVRHRIASFCMSGDTSVVAFRDKDSAATGQNSWTLEQLYSWQSDPKRKGRLRLIRLRSVNDAGVIVPGSISRVIDSGVQPVFQVTTESGRTLQATASHRLLTSDGWKELGALSIGDSLVANGVPALENPEWLFERYITDNNTLAEMAALSGACVSYVTRALRKYGMNKPLSMRKNRRPGHGVPGMLSDDARRAISERMSGANNHQWKGDQVSAGGGRLRANRWYHPDKCYGCGRTDKIERHHVDLDPVNNSPDNILFLCTACHKAWHLGAGVLTVFSDKIISIEPAGQTNTYDVEMASDPHNFVANGLVVHNSQESTRYCDYAGQEIEVVMPPDIESRGGEAYSAWYCAVSDALAAYKCLRQMEVKPEIARSVLPNCLKTELVLTANLREWRTIFKQRTSPKAHPQMRELMVPLCNELAARLPAVFGDLEVK